MAGWIKDEKNGQTYDIVLCRDKSTKMDGVTILLTTGNGDRIRGKKVGYLLTSIENDGHLTLRGLHIAEHFRGCGLSKLLISTWLLLCYKLNICRQPMTKRMDKPLISLVLSSSFGFTPENKQFPVHVGAPLSKDEKGRSRLWSTNNNRLRSIFSKNVCKTQKIEIVNTKPTESRLTYVRTIFRPPLNLSIQVDEMLNTIDHTWYSSKVIAFVSTFDALCSVVEKQTTLDLSGS